MACLTCHVMQACFKLLHTIILIQLHFTFIYQRPASIYRSQAQHLMSYYLLPHNVQFAGLNLHSQHFPLLQSYFNHNRKESPLMGAMNWADFVFGTNLVLPPRRLTPLKVGASVKKVTSPNGIFLAQKMEFPLRMAPPLSQESWESRILEMGNYP